MRCWPGNGSATTAAFRKLTVILSIPLHEKVNTKRKNGSARPVADFRRKRPGPMCKGYGTDWAFFLAVCGMSYEQRISRAFHINS